MKIKKFKQKAYFLPFWPLILVTLFIAIMCCNVAYQKLLNHHTKTALMVANILAEQSNTNNALTTENLNNHKINFIVTRSEKNNHLIHSYNEFKEQQLMKDLSSENITKETMLHITNQLKSIIIIQEEENKQLIIGLSKVKLYIEVFNIFVIIISIFLCIYLTLIFLFFYRIQTSYNAVKILYEYANQLSKHHFTRPLNTPSRLMTHSLLKNPLFKELARAFFNLEKKLIKNIQEFKTTYLEKEKIQRDISIAKDIQMNMIPKTFKELSKELNIDIHAYIRPAKEVGGDFYDYKFNSKKNIFSFLIGDVIGKGIPAALLMAMTTSIIKTSKISTTSPHIILNQVNEILCSRNHKNLMVTIFLGSLNLSTGELEYSIGGHPSPLLLKNNTIRNLETTDGIPLGIDADEKFSSKKITLEKDDCLFLYTDGITDARNKNRDFFGDNALIQSLKETSQKNPKTIILHLLTKIKNFSKIEEQADDITMFALQWKK